MAPTVALASLTAVINTPTPTLTGTGEPGGTITLTDTQNSAASSITLGTTTVAIDGTWSFTPASPLAGIGHSIVAIETDAAGNVSAPSTADAFTIASAVAAAVGDVHMTTFDGFHYDFQANGTYLLTQSTTPGNSFEVQIQTASIWSANAVSLTTAVAAQFGSDVLTFDANRPDEITINGIADTGLDMSHPIQRFAAGELVALSPTSVRLDWNTGESVTIDDEGTYFNTSVAIAPTDGPGSVRGLLGSDSGQANEFQLVDGTVLQQPMSDQPILGELASAWSVGPTTSLFGPGKGVASEIDLVNGEQITLGGVAENAIVFDKGRGGTPSLLSLVTPQYFTGTVAGMSDGDAIDLSSFKSQSTSITKIAGTGAAGTTTDVTLTDTGLGSASQMSVTLHLMNQFVSQFGASTSSYSLSNDHTTANGTLFQLAAHA